jgi:hypothetical protein
MYDNKRDFDELKQKEAEAPIEIEVTEDLEED